MRDLSPMAKSLRDAYRISEVQSIKKACPNPKQVKKISSRDYVLQFFRRIQNVGTYTELNSKSDTEDVGIQNFDKNSLAEGQRGIFTKMFVGYTTSATADESSTKVHRDNFPASLRNGILEIHHNSNKVLELPMSDFDPRTTGNNSEDLYFNFKTTLVFEGGIPFEFIIRLADGTVIADYSFFEFKLAGMLYLNQ